MAIEDSLGPPGPITVGKDFNFYQEITVSGVTEFPTEPQAVMGFRGQRRILFVCTSGSVEFSFNQGILHGAMNASNASNQLNFGPRQQDKIWIRGTGTIQIHAWQAWA